MLYALACIAAFTFVAYVMLPDSKKEWALAIPILGIGTAVVLAALFFLVITTWIGWTIHPLLGLFAGGFVLMFEFQLTKLILLECL